MNRDKSSAVRTVPICAGSYPRTKQRPDKAEDCACGQGKLGVVHYTVPVDAMAYDPQCVICQNEGIHDATRDHVMAGQE